MRGSGGGEDEEFHAGVDEKKRAEHEAQPEDGVRSGAMVDHWL